MRTEQIRTVVPRIDNLPGHTGYMESKGWENVTGGREQAKYMLALLAEYLEYYFEYYSNPNLDQAKKYNSASIAYFYNNKDHGIAYRELIRTRPHVAVYYYFTKLKEMIGEFNKKFTNQISQLTLDDEEVFFGVETEPVYLITHSINGSSKDQYDTVRQEHHRIRASNLTTYSQAYVSNARNPEDRHKRIEAINNPIHIEQPYFMKTKDCSRFLFKILFLEYTTQFGNMQKVNLLNKVFC